MSCNKKITNDILFDCTATGVSGIDNGTAVLINVTDIDLAATTVSGATISDLVLNAGSTGYKLEWYKQLASATSTFAPDAEAVDGFQHAFIGRMTAPTAESAERANELKNGRFIVVIETSFKGAGNADAFKVYGYETGLELSELTNSTAENAANLLFTLSTREGSYEQYPYAVFSETDYATSKAAFETLFAVA